MPAVPLSPVMLFPLISTVTCETRPPLVTWMLPPKLLLALLMILLRMKPSIVAPEVAGLSRLTLTAWTLALLMVLLAMSKSRRPFQPAPPPGERVMPPARAVLPGWVKELGDDEPTSRFRLDEFSMMTWIKSPSLFWKVLPWMDTVPTVVL